MVVSIYTQFDLSYVLTNNLLFTGEESMLPLERSPQVQRRTLRIEMKPRRFCQK